ncbi:MAG TPA: C39 family peptidase [Candidatus Scatomorpha stercoravium]|nr:C39 family peptidase [Candidatus Scatomorpha stercoravium]
MRDYDGYYRDGYYEPPPRRYRRRRRGRAGLVIFALILILALVFVWRFTDGFTRFAPPELTNVQDGFTYSLDALAGEISPDMRLDECGIDYKAELESMAANKPKLADRLNFIADHLEIYPEEAVKTALQGEEKLDFALLMPFRGEDAGGVNAVITAQKGTVPYLIQYDSRWAYHAYGSSVMGITACGPTCLSMAAICLTGDAGLTPARIADWAEGAGYYVNGAGTAWSLFTDGAAQLGLRSETMAADEDGMKSRLDAGEVLIASMLPGDFTTSGHFVVIVDHGLFGFNVYDPNSIALSSRAWSFDKLEPQIAQLWSLSAAPAGESLAGTTWYADCEEFITLRAEPNTGAAALTTIPRGGEMTYVSPAGEFTCVEYQGQRGYVLTSYIARSGGAPAVNPAPETDPPAESGGGLIDTAKEWLEKLM